MYKLSKFTLKLSFAASFIVVIGFAFLILNPEKEAPLVKAANADIFSFTGIDSENNFQRAVESMGIRPRPYDFNGNIMYFGSSRIIGSKSAEETANLVQEQLVISGVNKKNYMKENTQLDFRKKSTKEYREAMTSGELVVTRKEKNVYEMSGLSGVGSTNQFLHKIDMLSEDQTKKMNLADFVNGYKYIEVRQEEGEQTAEIIAVWTDDKFDAGKMANKEGTQQSSPDPKIPACIGCKRVRRVQALDKTEPYNINKWVTTSSIDETYAFYIASMGNRGWKESGKQQKLNLLASVLPEVAEIKGRGLSLEKDGQTIEITILPTKTGGAKVFSLEKYEDTQPTLRVIPKPLNFGGKVKEFFK